MLEGFRTDTLTDLGGGSWAMPPRSQDPRSMRAMSYAHLYCYVRLNSRRLRRLGQIWPPTTLQSRSASVWICPQITYIMVRVPISRLSWRLPTNRALWWLYVDCVLFFIQNSLPAEYFVVQLDCLARPNDVADFVVVCASSGRTLEYDQLLVAPISTMYVWRGIT